VHSDRESMFGSSDDEPHDAHTLGDETMVDDGICYDCAWLSLTALSTVTCNLWL
jgi:hypothetical protein